MKRANLGFKRGTTRTVILIGFFVFLSIQLFSPKLTHAACNLEYEEEFCSSSPPQDKTTCQVLGGASGTVVSFQTYNGDAQDVCPQHSLITDQTIRCSTHEEAKEVCGSGKADPFAGLGCSISSPDSVTHGQNINWGVGLESGSTISDIQISGNGVCGGFVGTGTKPCYVGQAGTPCTGRTAADSGAVRVGTCTLSVTTLKAGVSNTCTKGVAVNCTPSGTNTAIGIPTNPGEKAALNGLSTGARCNPATLPSVVYRSHNSNPLSIPSGVDKICVKGINSAGLDGMRLRYDGPGVVSHFRDGNANNNVAYAFNIRSRLDAFPNSNHRVYAWVTNLVTGACQTKDLTPSLFKKGTITPTPTPTPTSTPTPTPTPTPPPVSSFFQAFGGGVVAVKDITNSNLPATLYQTMNDGLDYAGVVTANSFTGPPRYSERPTGSSTGWNLANDYSFSQPPNLDYDSLKKVVTANSKLGANFNCSQANSFYRVTCYDPSGAFDGVLTTVLSANPEPIQVVIPTAISPDASLSIPKTIPANSKKFVVFVNGNLNITANVTSQNANSGIAFITSGDVTVGKDVTQLDGLFLTSGDITVASDSDDSVLNGNGVYLGALGGDSFSVSLARAPLAPNTSGENFYYEGKYLTLFNNILTRPKTKWSELAPN